jgi:hypothetical protein
VGFLRRLVGGGDRAPAGDTVPTGDATTTTVATTPDSTDDEGARERELLRAEAERLSGDLLARQLRFADRSWTPPAQGGPRRADDPDADDA